MHKYLRAIGFSDMKKKDLEILMQSIVEQPDKMTVAKDSEGNEFAEFLQMQTPQTGIAVRGTFDEEDEFVPDYCVPYFAGSEKTTNETIEVEKHIEKESYAGLCDDSRIGLTLIFTINDTLEMLAENKDKKKKIKMKGAYLSALSTEAKIILPIRQQHVVENYIDEGQRAQLKEAAFQGNEEALENLELQDMNLYSIISQRVKKEDLLTIVSTYLMPYGIESDLYGILADIQNVKEVENIVTEEHLYIIKVECNGLLLDVCVNKKDVMGIPAVGMRLKAGIWLLGTVCKD